MTTSATPMKYRLSTGASSLQARCANGRWRGGTSQKCAGAHARTVDEKIAEHDHPHQRPNIHEKPIVAISAGRVSRLSQFCRLRTV